MVVAHGRRGMRRGMATGAGTWREREAHDRGQDPVALAQARRRRGRRGTLERRDREAMGMVPGLVTARDGGRNRRRARGARCEMREGATREGEREAVERF
jgi:hypothetical protein